MKDDLTYIQGIGPEGLRQLNKAGIYTFAQLAECTPDQLCDALGESSIELGDVSKWIDQAKDFA